MAFPWLALLGGSLLGALGSSLSSSGGTTTVSTAREPEMIEQARSEALAAVAPILLDILQNPQEAIEQYTGLGTLVAPPTPAEWLGEQIARSLYETGSPFDIGALQSALGVLGLRPSDLILPQTTWFATELASAWPQEVGRRLLQVALPTETGVGLLSSYLSALGEVGPSYAERLKDFEERIWDYITGRTEKLRRSGIRKAALAAKELSDQARREAAARLASQMNKELSFFNLPELMTEEKAKRALETESFLSSLEEVPVLPREMTSSVLPYLMGEAVDWSGITRGKMGLATLGDWMGAVKPLTSLQIDAARLAREIGGAPGAIDYLKAFMPWAARERIEGMRERSAWEDLRKKAAEATLGLMRIRPAGTTTTSRTRSDFGGQFVSSFLSGLGLGLASYLT